MKFKLSFAKLYSAIALCVLLSSSFAHAADTTHQGQWTKKSFGISGGWSIEMRGDQNVLVLDKGFKTKNAPDLKIFLSSQKLGEANGGNATNNAILLSALKSNKGAQEYVIPASVDLNDFTTLLIHCEQYSKLWGGSAL